MKWTITKAYYEPEEEHVSLQADCKTEEGNFLCQWLYCGGVSFIGGALD